MTGPLLIVLCLLALCFPAQAQQQSAKRQEAVKELRTELRQWFMSDVLPTMSRMHSEFDASLSREDLATLARLRVDARRLRNQVRTDIKSLKDDFERGGRAELRNRLKALREKHRDEYMRIVEQVKPIAKRSRTKLRELFDANEEKIEQWRAQSRKIIGDWKDDHDELGLNDRGIGRLPLLGSKDPRKSTLRFILWDGTVEERDGETE